MYGNEPKLKWRKRGLTKLFLAKVLEDYYVETVNAVYWVNWNNNTFTAEIWQRKPGERAEQVAEYEI